LHLSIPVFFLGGAFYIGGVLLYGFNMPEKLFPRRFDIVGASHQIFHLSVIAGSLTHIVMNTLVFHER
jgi:adiponectin receptor